MTVTAEDVESMALTLLNLHEDLHGWDEVASYINHTAPKVVAMLRALLQERDDAQSRYEFEMPLAVNGARRLGEQIGTAAAYEHAADEAEKRAERSSNPHSTYNNSTGQKALEIFAHELRVTAAQARQE